MATRETILNKRSSFDFLKKLWYNIYIKWRKEIKNMFDDFASEIQSDEIAAINGYDWFFENED